MMGTNSEARKAAAERFAAQLERRREVTRLALEKIMDGASFDDADALLDAYSDLGASVVVQ